MITYNHSHSPAHYLSFLSGELAAWSANQYLGCLLTFVGAGVYSYLKAAGSRKPAPPVLPGPDGGQKGSS